MRLDITSISDAVIVLGLLLSICIIFDEFRECNDDASVHLSGPLRARSLSLSLSLKISSIAIMINRSEIKAEIKSASINFQIPRS